MPWTAAFEDDPYGNGKHGLAKAIFENSNGIAITYVQVVNRTQEGFKDFVRSAKIELDRTLSPLTNDQITLELQNLLNS